MKQTLIAFFKKPTTIIGIVTAIMFQLIFSIVWMTGYAGVTSNIEQLKIGIVNEDSMIGKEVVAQVSEQLPFETEMYSSLENAKDDLNHREIYMVMHIPSTFTQELSSPNQANIRFILNESNSQMVKSVMQGVLSSITTNVNKESVIMGVQKMLSEYQIPPDQAESIAKQLAERVVSQVEIVNPVDNFSSQMVPLMLVLASYVGAMIMGLNMQQSAMALGGSINRWQGFIARGMINILSAIVIGFIGTTMINVLGAQIEHGFLMMWGFQSLFVLTFLFVAQIFVLMMGPAGMLFNIIMLSVQLVSSGAMVPRELLAPFYFELSKYLPATYAVEGVMNILFGGASTAHSVVGLVWIILGAIGIGVLVVAISRKEASSEIENLSTT